MKRAFLLLFLASLSPGSAVLAAGTTWQASCGQNGRIVFMGVAPADASESWREDVAARHPESLCVFMMRPVRDAVTQTARSMPHSGSEQGSSAVHLDPLAEVLAEISGRPETSMAVSERFAAAPKAEADVPGDAAGGLPLPALDGGYVAQLAAIHGGAEDVAFREWRRIARLASYLRDYEPLIIKHTVDGEPWSAVRVGPFSRPDAARLCSRLRHDGIPCFATAVDG